MANPVVVNIPAVTGAKIAATAIAQNVKTQLRLTLPTVNGIPTKPGRREVQLRFDKDVLLSESQDLSDAAGANWFPLPATEPIDVTVDLSDGTGYKDVWVLCADAAGTTAKGWTP